MEETNYYELTSYGKGLLFDGIIVNNDVELMNRYIQILGDRDFDIESSVGRRYNNIKDDMIILLSKCDSYMIYLLSGIIFHGSADRLAHVYSIADINFIGVVLQDCVIEYDGKQSLDSRIKLSITLDYFKDKMTLGDILNLSYMFVAGPYAECEAIVYTIFKVVDVDKLLSSNIEDIDEITTIVVQYSGPETLIQFLSGYVSESTKMYISNNRDSIRYDVDISDNYVSLFEECV